MSTVNRIINHSATPAGLIAFNVAFGATLVSIGAAHWGFPTIAWSFWYLSLLGFIALLALGAAILVATVVRALSRRIGTSRHAASKGAKSSAVVGSPAVTV